MSTIIVNRLISGLESDNKLVLNNSSAARTISIGTGWLQLRVGFRVSISGSGTLNFFPHFTFGLCSGTGRAMSDNVVDAFMGIGYTGTSWTYVHNGYIPEFLPSTTNFLTKTGLVVTSSSTSQPTLGANYTGVRQSIFFEMSKSDNSLSLLWRANGGAAITKDLPSGTFLGAMGVNPGINNIESYLNANGGADGHSQVGFTTTPYSALYNLLDTVCFSWNSSAANIEISDVAYARIG